MLVKTLVLMLAVEVVALELLAQTHRVILVVLVALERHLLLQVLLELVQAEVVVQLVVLELLVKVVLVLLELHLL